MTAALLRFRLAVAGILLLVAAGNAGAISTGTPVKCEVDPATVRQGEKNESPVVMTVLLRSPASHYFICQIRSADPGKISFDNIIFMKGQLMGTSTGKVHWDRVFQDCTVRISAFNEDLPDEKLLYTVSLKTKNLDQ